MSYTPSHNLISHLSHTYTLSSFHETLCRNVRYCAICAAQQYYPVIQVTLQKYHPEVFQHSKKFQHLLNLNTSLAAIKAVKDGQVSTAWQKVKTKRNLTNPDYWMLSSTTAQCWATWCLRMTSVAYSRLGAGQPWLAMAWHSLSTPSTRTSSTSSCWSTGRTGTWRGWAGERCGEGHLYPTCHISAGTGYTVCASLTCKRKEPVNHSLLTR